MVLRRGPPNQGAASEGQRIARLFRQYRELGDVRACDLEAILAEDEIEVTESCLSDPGYTACLLRVPGIPGGGIWLAPGQDAGRRRFSLAHELGHFHIPAHASRQVVGPCADADLRARSTDVRILEWEANEFAAELLMPRRLFSKDVSRIDFSISQAQRLAGPAMYDVSLTAAAWRMVQTSREPCAVVVATAGRVEWIARSSSFRLPLTERHQPLHPDTLAAGTFRGEGSILHPRKVPVGVWLEEAVSFRGELLESTFGVSQYDQVLSLLWLAGSEDSATSDEDLDE